ncbi:hydroxyacid dehydrogenase [Cohaesibacter celericrescens]|uniref:Hydroxyacid dehydrogenase n=2 Tax=Cohaesibacter celericrescens TaxID=2067669 RepID=A0A2N5XV48_9HYPH|nr:2-hydroxyacid dehydrogenase [Cohaesibacter celericrescens]PLW78315.1 hydroxyacid dehydrogenase [Cohaesibacter celericrescens]
MDKPHILQIGPYPEWDMERLEKQFEVHRYFEARDKAAFVAERAGLIRGIATRAKLGANKALIDALPNLEIISVYGVGYDAVDLEAAKAAGVRVTNTPDVLTGDVADLSVAMMLTASRGVIGAQDWVRSGDWQSKGSFPLQTRVFGKRVGILGLGRIGYEIARRCAAFDMDVAYRNLKPKDLAEDWTFESSAEALAERSDFLFVTLTGGAANKHVVDQKVIEALGPNGMLINVSRATNVDETALLEALEKKTLGFACLDVFEGEPALNPRFIALDNVLLQPHHASGTFETRKAMGKLVFDNLVAQFEGRPLPTPVI